MNNEGYARYRKMVGPVEGGPFYYKLLEMTKNGSLGDLQGDAMLRAVIDAVEADRERKTE